MSQIVGNPSSLEKRKSTMVHHQENELLEQAMQKLARLESLCVLAEKNNDAEDGEESSKLSCLGAKYSLRLRTIEQDFHDAYNEADGSGAAGGSGGKNKESFEDARERIAALKAMIKKASTV